MTVAIVVYKSLIPVVCRMLTPISQIDRSVFDDVSTWGVSSLQGWINSYESVRFVAINDHMAVITGEYNFEQVKVWLEKNVPIQSLKIS